jgi:hypothetical protein
LTSYIPLARAPALALFCQKLTKIAFSMLTGKGRGKGKGKGKE